MPKNAKAEARREAQFYARQDRIRCAVCGQHYLTRDKRGWACSKKCAERLQALEGRADENH